MIQFNLLPDVKQIYIRTQRIKRLVLSVSFIASIAALSIFLLFLFSVYVVQRKIIGDLNNNIKVNSATLRNSPNIANILTVQSQLNSLSTLHAQKPVASRLFGYLAELTPNSATISDLTIDFTQNTLTITGNSQSLDVVNTYVDTLKFTTYSLDNQSGTTNAFSKVILSAFTRTSNTATYTITMAFDPVIFNNSHTVTLSIGGQPQNTNQQPSIIFKKGS